MFPEQIPDLQTAISHKDFAFDFYIINLVNKLYVLSKDEIKGYDISNEDIVAFKEHAAEYEINNQ